jgi:hypothetical protein
VVVVVPFDVVSPAAVVESLVVVGVEVLVVAADEELSVEEPVVVVEVGEPPEVVAVSPLEPVAVDPPALGSDTPVVEPGPVVEVDPVVPDTVGLLAPAVGMNSAKIVVVVVD